MFVEFLIKNFFQSCSARTGFTPMHCASLALKIVNNLLDQVFVKSESIASTSNTTFWWAPQTQTDWVIFEPARTHYLDLKAQNFENPILTIGLTILWKQCIILASYKYFFKLQTFGYVFLTNIVFLFRHLPAEVVIFTNVFLPDEVFQWW